jgi:wobble nucleotide-excising tRNase
MTPQIKTAAQELEAEYADLKITFDRLHAEWKKGAAMIAPIELKMRQIEQTMDGIKPRLRELENSLTFLRKALA